MRLPFIQGISISLQKDYSVNSHIGPWSSTKMFKNLLEILKNHFLECFKTGLWLNASGIKNL